MIVCCVNNLFGLVDECAEYFPSSLWMEAKAKACGTTQVVLKSEGPTKQNKLVSERELEILSFKQNHAASIKHLTLQQMVDKSSAIQNQDQEKDKLFSRNADFTNQNQVEYAALIDKVTDFVIASNSKAFYQGSHPIERNQSGPQNLRKLLVHSKEGDNGAAIITICVNASIAIREQIEAGVKSPQISLFSIVRRSGQSKLKLEEYIFIAKYIKQRFGASI